MKQKGVPASRRKEDEDVSSGSRREGGVMIKPSDDPPMEKTYVLCRTWV